MLELYGIKAKKVSKKVEKSKKPVLIEEVTDYVSGTKRVKYYYATEEMKQLHIEKMKKEGYTFDEFPSGKETICKTPITVQVIAGSFYIKVESLIG